MHTEALKRFCGEDRRTTGSARSLAGCFAEVRAQMPGPFVRHGVVPGALNSQQA